MLVKPIFHYSSLHNEVQIVDDILSLPSIRSQSISNEENSNVVYLGPNNDRRNIQLEQ